MTDINHTVYFSSRKQAKLNNDVFYMPKKPCKKGHTSLKYASNGSCCECHYLRYYSDHKATLDKAKDYQEKNREIINKKWREKYKDNPENHKEKNKKYYYSNKENIKISQKEYRLKNRDVILEKVKTWVKNNYTRHLINVKKNTHKRRLKVKQCGSSYSLSDIVFLQKIQRNKCVNCKCDITKKYHIDHIMPISLGGDNSAKNIQLLCADCNLRKNAKHPIVWAQENGRLV